MCAATFSARVRGGRLALPQLRELGLEFAERNVVDDALRQQLHLRDVLEGFDESCVLPLCILPVERVGHDFSRDPAWVRVFELAANITVLVGGDLVLLTSNAGMNFYVGNHAANSTGRYRPPPFAHANPLHEELDFEAEPLRRTGQTERTMRPSELSRFWFREAAKEIRDDPGHFFRHTWRKTRLFFNHFEVPDNQSYYYFREHVAPMLRLPLPTWGLLLPLGLLGMALSASNRRALFLSVCFAGYALSVILFFNLSRYRLPMAPLIIVFASFAVFELAALVRRRSFGPALAALLFLIAGYALTSQDIAVIDLKTRHADTIRAQADQFLHIFIGCEQTPSAIDDFVLRH